MTHPKDRADVTARWERRKAERAYERLFGITARDEAYRAAGRGMSCGTCGGKLS